MTNQGITCHVNDSLAQAVQLMADHGCSTIVVLRSDDQIAGRLTERDVCMAALGHELPLHDILVHKAMSHHASPPAGLEVSDVA